MQHLEEIRSVRNLRSPVLLAGFRIQQRAGRLGARAINYLVDEWQAEAVARIDLTPFLDLAFNRPSIRRTETESRIEWPAATVYLSRSAATDRDLLLLSSVEPNFLWPTFADTIAEYVQLVGIETVVTMRAHAGVVPHTRPSPVYLTASDSELEHLFGEQSNRTKYEGPISIAGVMTDRLQALGLHTAELAVIQPDYFPRMPCAEAMISLLTFLDRAFGTTTEIAGLRQTASEQREMLDQATASSDETRQEIESRERSYDKSLQEREFLSPEQMPSELPSGEEVANDIERFFRGSASDG